ETDLKAKLKSSHSLFIPGLNKITNIGGVSFLTLTPGDYEISLKGKVILEEFKQEMLNENIYQEDVYKQIDKNQNNLKEKNTEDKEKTKNQTMIPEHDVKRKKSNAAHERHALVCEKASVISTNLTNQNNTTKETT